MSPTTRTPPRWTGRAGSTEARACWPSGSRSTPDSARRARSVGAFDHEERPADRAGQLGLLPRELEALGQLIRHLHAVGQLEPDGTLPTLGQGVHDVDRETRLVEDVRHPDPVDLERGRLERRRRDDEVALLLEDAMDVVDYVRRLARGFDGEGVGVLVLVVPSLVRPQTGQRLRMRGRLQSGRGDVLEVDGVGHDHLRDRCLPVQRYVRPSTAMEAESANPAAATGVMRPSQVLGRSASWNSRSMR